MWSGARRARRPRANVSTGLRSMALFVLGTRISGGCCCPFRSGTRRTTSMRRASENFKRVVRGALANLGWAEQSEPTTGRAEPRVPIRPREPNAFMHARPLGLRDTSQQGVRRHPLNPRLPTLRAHRTHHHRKRVRLIPEEGFTSHTHSLAHTPDNHPSYVASSSEVRATRASRAPHRRPQNLSR